MESHSQGTKLSVYKYMGMPHFQLRLVFLSLLCALCVYLTSKLSDDMDFLRLFYAINKILDF